MLSRSFRGVAASVLSLAAALALVLPLAAQDWHRVSSGGAGGIVAYDPVRQRVVMFDRTNTWEWDGVEWAQRFPLASPGVRDAASMGFDPVSGRVILFGGQDANSTYLNQTWAWDGTTWQRLFPARSPMGRADAAMVTDGARGRLLLFGGQIPGCVGACPLGDLWEWDGGNWVLLAAPGPGRPQAVSGPRLAYDASRLRVVLFGGDLVPGHGFPSGDTWEWDGAAWTMTGPALSPEGRTGHAMAYDPVSRRVMLYGGDEITMTSWREFQDTWSYDGSTWSPLALTGNPGVASGHMVFDPALGRVVLVAGTNWAWNGAQWVAPPGAPAPQHNPALAFDAARGRAVLYAGAPSAELWEWDGRQWSLAAASSPPGTTSTHSMAYDAARGVVVMVVPGASPGTWTWNGTSWSSPLPAPGAGPLAYDEARGVVVQLVDNGETWTWDGTGWTRRATTGPPARQRAALAYDPARQRVVLFGGTTDPRVPSASRNDTWEWNGASWTQAQPAVSPPARFDHGMAYDFALGAVVVAGGSGGTWAWDGVSWRAVATTNSPASGVDLVSDTVRGRLVAVEARSIAGQFSSAPYWLRTWEFGVITAAAATRSGLGCGRVVPSLGTLGVPRAGRTQFAIDVGRAPAGAPGALLFSAAAASIPLGSECTLYVDPAAALALPFAAGPAGYSSLTLPIPAQAAVGISVYVQGALLDPGSPLGFALSGRLGLTIGE